MSPWNQTGDVCIDPEQRFPALHALADGDEQLTQPIDVERVS
jgi:hypothetical protein